MRMVPTMDLINLQTYAISKDESIIADSGEYKSTPEVLKILSKCWSKSDKNEKDYLEKLVASTPYECKQV